MAGALDERIIRQAFEQLGKRLGFDAELVLVGGAAGLFMGILPPHLTTGDVDAVDVRPPSENDEIQRLAGQVGRELGLPPFWLNTDAGLFRGTLPEGWEQRRARIDAFGRLTVFALSRTDWIATKFFSHRGVDLEHLKNARVTTLELDFARQHALKLSDNPEFSGRAEMTMSYLDAWKRES